MEVGDKIPEFESVDVEGKPFHSHSVIGQKLTVLYFYPKDFTPGCTKEACRFQKIYDYFKEREVELIGVSSDSVRSHKQFCRKYGIKFKLLSDPKQELRRKLGIKKHLFNTIPGRETLIIDKTGTLRYKFHKLAPAPHVQKALEFVKKIQDE